MDLWIRSQDKYLLAKYNMLAVAQITPIPQAKVMAFVSDDLGYQELGAYKTKERALEVLDEIQKYVDGKPIVKYSRMGDKSYIDNIRYLQSNGFIGVEDTVDIIPASTMVYQMPQE